VRVNVCWFESKNMAAVTSADCEQVGMKWGTFNSLQCMCRLSQIAGEDSSIHISSSVSSFVQTFFPAMFTVLLSTHALNYTGFPGLVQVAAESKCGASLYGHRKCSQAGCLLVNCDLGVSALKGGYMLESTLPDKQRGTCMMFTLMCNPALTAVHVRG
jgi:hypothetical protein